MRALAILLCLSMPTLALAQAAPPAPDAPPPPPLVSPPPINEPPPPSYPPSQPVQQPNLVPNNLQPYAPMNPPGASAAHGSEHEFGLAAAEYFASAAVTIAASIAVASAIGTTDTAEQAATAQIAALLYIALIPAVSALPAWAIGLISDRYDPHIGPAIEAGSVISGVAVIIYLIASETDANTGETSPWIYVAGGLLIVAMPIAEVVSLNLNKTPKGSAVPYFGERAPPILPELPVAHADLGLPMPHTLVVGMPAFHF